MLVISLLFCFIIFVVAVVVGVILRILKTFYMKTIKNILGIRITYFRSIADFIILGLSTQGFFKNSH